MTRRTPFHAANHYCPAHASQRLPVCSAPMEPGWITLWNPFLGQKVRWMPTAPGSGRRGRVPEGSAVLLQARVGGKDARQALRCTSCAAMVIPPDPTYDDE